MNDTRRTLLGRIARVAVTTGAMVLLVWSIAFPSLPGAHPPGSHPDESAARATLVRIADAQLEFRRRHRLDRDGDGVAEFGWFSQLADEAAPLLPEPFRRPTSGRIERGNYVFELWLPASTGSWISESGQAPIDVDGAEQRWLAYAWPMHGSSARRVFHVDATGTVLARTNDGGRYCGHVRPAPVDAALPSSAAVDPGNDARLGRDGVRWRVSR